jgi:sec-independent protein translocase protein TatA
MGRIGLRQKEEDDMPFGLGPMELLIILVIIILIFGANRIGEIGGALGKTVREFRKELKDDVPPVVKAEDKKLEEKKVEDK